MIQRHNPVHAFLFPHGRYFLLLLVCCQAAASAFPRVAVSSAVVSIDFPPLLLLTAIKSMVVCYILLQHLLSCTPALAAVLLQELVWLVGCSLCSSCSSLPLAIFLFSKRSCLCCRHAWSCRHVLFGLEQGFVKSNVTVLSYSVWKQRRNSALWFYWAPAKRKCWLFFYLRCRLGLFVQTLLEPVWPQKRIRDDKWKLGMAMLAAGQGPCSSQKTSWW